VQKLREQHRGQSWHQRQDQRGDGEAGLHVGDEEIGPVEAVAALPGRRRVQRPPDLTERAALLRSRVPALRILAAIAPGQARAAPAVRLVVTAGREAGFRGEGRQLRGLSPEVARPPDP